MITRNVSSSFKPSKLVHTHYTYTHTFIIYNYFIIDININMHASGPQLGPFS